ncbi:hypothetical protein, partial [Pelomicrobium sp. G1]|uniref:hypothetical protein n=1 Tax=Pelomicrobium sp. G1 TaxID=3452920 RepID=UPI003F75FC62
MFERHAADPLVGLDAHGLPSTTEARVTRQKEIFNAKGAKGAKEKREPLKIRFSAPHSSAQHALAERAVRG